MESISKIKAQSISFVQCMFMDRGYTDIVTSTDGPFPNVRCQTADGVSVMAIFATVSTGNSTVEMVKAPVDSTAVAKPVRKDASKQEVEEPDDVEPDVEDNEDNDDAEVSEADEAEEAEEADETNESECEDAEQEEVEEDEEAEEEEEEDDSFQHSDKDSKNMGVNLIKSLHEYALKHSIGIVIIVSDRLTPHAYKHAMAQRDVEFVHFTYGETGVRRLARHIYQPVLFERLQGQALDTFIKGMPNYATELLRYSFDDALVKYYGLHIGDIVRVEDADRQTGLVVEYALIVEHL